VRQLKTQNVDRKPTNFEKGVFQLGAGREGRKDDRRQEQINWVHRSEKRRV